ncbi:XrtA system polysaccharide chain length determinant [Chitinimonas sp. PSY-7]|uniref:XrtA system polysaccharide chain length determinant n=1 Tax=Chitinimonas sp. PSY-7 TaxID=3459088 RepID=UPI0040401657
MDDLIRQVIKVLRDMWTRRWLGLAIAWIVGIISVAVLLKMPDKYEASARIFVDTQSILKPLMSGLAVEPDVDQQISILSRTLISRPNVEKLVRMADLDLKIKTKDAQEELIDDLMKSLVIKSTSRDNLYTLSYRDTKPDQAKRVVQSLVSIFVESSLGGKREDSDTAKKFIDDQIRVYEKKLEDAENRLKEFKLRNFGVQSSDGKDYFGRVSEVGTALELAKLELRAAENSRDALKRQISGEDAVLLPDAPQSTVGISIPEIDGRIEVMQKNLDAMLQRFTDQHPDVVSTRRLLKDLEEQKKQEIANRRKDAQNNPTVSVNANPVYQQLKISLAESEANVASLRAKASEYQSRYNNLQASARLIPQVEAEFTQLNRDYDINKKNYESLVARRESATISGEMEASASGLDFRLIDPPRVSPQPVAPNRLLLLPLTLLAALAAGVLASFLASQIRPVILDSRTLRELSGLPLLGTITLVASDAAKRREKRSLYRFVAGFISLVGVYGAGIALLFVFSSRTV